MSKNSQSSKMSQPTDSPSSLEPQGPSFDRTISPVEIKLTEASREINLSSSTKSDLENTSPLNSEANSEVSTRHSEMMQVMLAHKKHVLKNQPEAKEINGFPPVKLMECEQVQKITGYKEKRIPYRMRGKKNG